MESFEQLLAESTRIHGHICAGQVIGVRMAMEGLGRIGIEETEGCITALFLGNDPIPEDRKLTRIAQWLSDRHLRWL